MKSNVCSIIVTYNPNQSDLQSLIDSMTAQVEHIIIVDNNSSVKVSLINTPCSLELITLDTNVGIGKAQNIGVARAKERGHDFVCLFDQDSKLETGFISSLVKAYHALTAEGIKVGALGPLIVDERSNKQFPFYTYDGFRRNVIYPESVKGKYIETHQLISSGTFFSTSVWSITGGNHEGFFLEYVDTDWCLRVVNLGYKIFSVKEAKLIHKLGDDRRKLFGIIDIPVHANYRYFYVFRNGLFCSLYRPFPIAWRIYNLFRLASFSIIMLIIKPKKINLLKYILLGTYDGIRKSFSRNLF
ncbi:MULTISPECIES: glycosyltransferase family 2 protein [unclassified Serratia (in: enterobacteria)]|uniref:glycosyltransferase family 2 protein n=1 Tax=unclassified Serratia (in: enterobacteria) TaxID=2647522 RepID=UPI00307628FF